MRTSTPVSYTHLDVYKRQVLPTTDIFSFGVLAFQLLTGSLPFGELSSHNELAQMCIRDSRNAVYGNLKLMKKTLNEKQYADYARVLNVTLQNKDVYKRQEIHISHNMSCTSRAHLPY